jgi:L-seryl-tRNA(Ser) seleniumtransferase
VGTTNRTHLADYERAIGENTGLLLKVHTSNFSVVGFTAAVPMSALVALGARHRLPVMEDLGSGTFVDFSAYGLFKEPTVQESVAAGADPVTFSGDKLLGGPQAGIILGSRDIIGQIRQNPLTRALRIDKMTLAALESTLRLYRDEREAVAAVPTLRDLTRPLGEIAREADRLAEAIRAAGGERIQVRTQDGTSRAGGGSLPLLELPSRCVAVRVDGMSANTVERRLRAGDPPVVGRIEDEALVLDPRGIRDEEIPLVAEAFRCLVQGA